METMLQKKKKEMAKFWLMRMRHSTILFISPWNLRQNPAASWKSAFYAKLRVIQKSKIQFNG